MVTKGQHVSRYEKIGEAQGPISANVHSPISGTGKEIRQVAGTDGHYMT
ncbi:MAG: electron transporter RnfC, partial [Muribaculaceae bacterium]|nr:electron transporter RnfC [Muribaculaceae bacterium]